MELRCDQVLPGLGCDYTATGTTIDDLDAAITTHITGRHANLTAGMSPADQQQRNQDISNRITALHPRLARPPSG